jgi:hypothetical protein
VSKFIDGARSAQEREQEQKCNLPPGPPVALNIAPVQRFASGNGGQELEERIAARFTSGGGLALAVLASLDDVAELS